MTWLDFSQFGWEFRGFDRLRAKPKLAETNVAVFEAQRHIVAKLRKSGGRWLLAINERALGNNFAHVSRVETEGAQHAAACQLVREKLVLIHLDAPGLVGGPRGRAAIERPQTRPQK